MCAGVAEGATSTSRPNRSMLAPLVQRAVGGGILTVTKLPHAYQDRAGKEVARSTLFRLLQRHGWRKEVPHPQRPEADVAAWAAFRRTAPRGTPRGLAPG